MRVSIIGGGIMGLSVARALIKQGINVRLFEQFTIPNPRGSSCDDHRLIRYPYGTHRGYMMMVQQAYAAWERVWVDIERVHYAQTGTLVTSRTGEGWANDSLEALREANIPLIEVHTERLTEYIPLLQLNDVKLAYYLESGGVLFARRILSSLKNYLIKNGVEIIEQTKITSIDSANQHLHTTSGDVHSFDQLVVTAGPWANDLVSSLPVTPSQQTVHYLDIPDTDLASWKQAPMLLDIDLDSGFYLVPPVGGLGLKIGDHRFSMQGHPDNPSSNLAREDIGGSGSNLSLFSSLGNTPLLPPVIRSKTCYYTVAPNEEFIYQQAENIHILTGFSGHGFKFGPIIGDQFAKVVAGRLEADTFASWLAGD